MNIINNTIPAATNMKRPPLPESFLSPVPPVSHVLVPVDDLVVLQFDFWVKLVPEQYVERDGVHEDGEQAPEVIATDCDIKVFSGCTPAVFANW